MKTILHLAILSFSLLFSLNLQAQYPKPIAFEASIGGGYGQHNLKLDPFLELFAPGLDQQFLGRAYVQVGFGANKRLNKRLDFHLGLHALRGAFRVKVDGLLFGTDIKNNFNNPNSSTLITDFNYWNLELPVWADLHLNDRVLLSLGGGMMVNLTMAEKSKIMGSLGENNAVIGVEYDLGRLSSFALVGIGFPFFIKDSKYRIIPRLTAQYFFVDGLVEGFGPVNRILQTGASVAFEF